MLTKYKAVFFDVGGTLLRVHPSVGEVYSKMARGYGFSGSPEEVAVNPHSVTGAYLLPLLTRSV